MNSISCKRFRRFENLEPIEFKDVNFFVGTNNSGKSSVVKAVLLLLDNFTKEAVGIDPVNKLPLFDLSTQYAHIGDFKRAFHKTHDEESIRLAPTFELCGTIKGYTIKVVVGESSLGTMFACYETVSIKGNDISFFADFRNNPIKYICGKESNKKDDFDYKAFNDVLNDYQQYKQTVRLLSKKITSYREQLDKGQNYITRDIKDVENDLIKVINERDKILIAIKELDKSILQMLDVIGIEKGNLGYHEREFNFQLISALSKNIINNRGSILYYLEDFVRRDRSILSKILSDENYDKLHPFTRFGSLDSYQFRYKYLYAHNVYQNSYFSTLDKNDHVAKALDEYYKFSLSSNRHVEEGVDYWLQQFEIGVSLKITPILGGEIYTASVQTFSGEEISLQDLGMGAIQIIVLLLRLMSIEPYTQYPLLLIIEEPEQNIHPKLQSVMADLFAYIHRMTRAQILVETHSEYMIRRTQLIIANGGYEINGEWKEVQYENNPFQVYYFPQEGQPYSLGYQESGLFERPFGEGFFDESSNLLMPVLMKARRSK